MAKYDQDGGYPCGLQKECDCGLDASKSTSEVLGGDPDVAEIIKWLDFKSCGWSPEQAIYRGARKLIAKL